MAVAAAVAVALYIAVAVAVAVVVRANAVAITFSVAILGDAVTEAITNLQGTVTMLVIAHRLGTIEKCDRVVDLGRLTNTNLI